MYHRLFLLVCFIFGLSFSNVVFAENTSPTAENIEVNATEDVLQAITLVGNDPDGDKLTYVLPKLKSANRGKLALQADGRTVHYTPKNNFSGTDTFSYRVVDTNKAKSELAIVTIFVKEENDPPIAKSVKTTTKEDTVRLIDLSKKSKDQEGGLLQFNVVDAPKNGQASVDANTGMATYTPLPDFNGTDTFTFKVNDGELDSLSATVTIKVSSVNDAPVVDDISSLVTQENTPLDIVLSGHDVDGDGLTYLLPKKRTEKGGKLLIQADGKTVMYTPKANFFGNDSFNYQVRDTNKAKSNLGIVSIHVAEVNDPPIARSGKISVKEDTVSAFTLRGKDPQGDLLSFTLVDSPLNGQVQLNPQTGEGTYTPALNFNGDDSFTFKVSDGELESSPATVVVKVKAINDRPIADNLNSLTTVEDSPLNILLLGHDVDGDDLTYLLPKKLKTTEGGTLLLQADGKTVTYTPKINFSGNDSFSYRVQDTNKLKSTLATVSITVSEENDAPTVSSAKVVTGEDISKSFTLANKSKDPEGGSLTFSLVDLPRNGQVNLDSNTGEGVYVPTTNFNGTDSFTFKTNDGELDSVTALVSIVVKAVNDAPIAHALPLLGETLATSQGAVLNLMLFGQDVEDDESALTYLLPKIKTTNNGKLVLNEDGKTVAYIPKYGFTGSDTFTYAVRDSGKEKSSPATVTIEVLNQYSKLNDTGVSECTDPFSTETQSCPLENYPKQDGEFGRDSDNSTNSDLDGHSGFSFTKLGSKGQALAIQNASYDEANGSEKEGTKWSCIKDNITGLVWEVKTRDGKLRDKDWSYTWYDPSHITSNGEHGTQDGGYCYNADNSDCDTFGYVNKINLKGLCGTSDWRVPTKSELLSIVNYGAASPSIDEHWFPNTLARVYQNNNKGTDSYWTSSPLAAEDSNYAWRVYFATGFDSLRLMSEAHLIRLVRDDK